MALIDVLVELLFRRDFDDEEDEERALAREDDDTERDLVLWEDIDRFRTITSPPNVPATIPTMNCKIVGSIIDLTTH